MTDLEALALRVLRLETERDASRERLNTISHQISDLTSALYLGLETSRKREERIEASVLRLESKHDTLAANLFDIIQDAVRPLLEKE